MDGKTVDSKSSASVSVDVENVANNNQYRDLEVFDTDGEIVDNNTLGSAMEVKNVTPVQQKTCKQECKSCARVLVNFKRGQSKVCTRCKNHSFAHQKRGCSATAQKRGQQTCVMNARGSKDCVAQVEKSNDDVELVPLRQFIRGGKTHQYLNYGVICMEKEIDDVEQAELNFTHRSAHGGQDDADVAHGTLTDLANSQLKELQQKYGSVFADPVYPVDRSNCPVEFQHSIPLQDENAVPPKRKLYPLDNQELIELKKQIQTFLESNRIEPANGPYGAPILFAKKKDGGLRMCIDYRMLNQQTVSDVFPLPRIDELLQRLDGSVVFSKLDLRDGYHQIPMQQSDKVKTSFSCRYGTYQFTVMPFGLSSAPSTF